MKTGDTKKNFCICRPLELIPSTAQAQSTHAQSTFDMLLRNQISQPNATIWKQLTDYYVELLANNMNEAEALDTLRNTAHTRFAIRAKVCPRGQTICCGTCTYVCSERCGLDIAIRIQLRLMTMKADQKRLELTMPREEVLRRESALNRSIRLLVESPTSTASQFNALINQLISGYWNAENRRELRMNGNYENPNKLNYSPRLEYEAHPKSGKPRIKANPDTGEVVVLTWPNSGLCPFCLPTNSARHRMPKSR
jgi:hypothetical protein